MEVKTHVCEYLRDKLADFAESFYWHGSRWAGKASNLLRLAHLVSWLTRNFQKSPGLLGLEVLVGISLVAYFFFLVGPQAEAPRAHDGNEMNPYLFTYLSDHPYSQKDIIPFVNWRARLAGPMISGRIWDLV
jgi:hypothetical protein